MKHHPGLYDVHHNYHVKKKKKKKNSKKDWHVTLARKEFRCWSWFCFLQAQIHKKKNILLTENGNLKHETIFLFAKFANCDNWIFRPESPVEKICAFSNIHKLFNFPKL